MTWKKSLFQNFKLYAITDLKSQDPEILKKIEAAYRGGADIVQIRSKSLSDSELLRVAQKARIIADQQEKLLFINDRADLAIAANADGIHVGQDDLPVETIRALAKAAGVSLFIGKSTHSLEQALAAQKEKVNYIGVGPVFSTPTKPGRRPVGLELVREVSRAIEIPFVAIGGIDEANVESVLNAGANRIAVVRAIFDAKDITYAAQNLCEKISSTQKIKI